MKQRYLGLLSTICILMTIAVLHTAGLYWSLYWVYWWFDIVTHFIGGVGIGLLFSLFYLPKKYIYLFGFVIMIVWELFEFFVVKIKIYSHSEFAIDTISDLFIGFVGISIGIWLFNKFFK